MDHLEFSVYEGEVPRPPKDAEDSPLTDEERAICLRFRQVRFDLGLKQIAIADKLGISVSRLKSYDRARSPIRFGIALDMCRAFNVSLRWIAAGQGRQQPYFRISGSWIARIPRSLLLSRVYHRLLKSPLKATEEAALAYAESAKTGDSTPVLVPGFAVGALKHEKDRKLQMALSSEISAFIRRSRNAEIGVLISKIREGLGGMSKYSEAIIANFLTEHEAGEDQQTDEELTDEIRSKLEMSELEWKRAIVRDRGRYNGEE